MNRLSNIPATPTNKFRYWSRKGYAIFASLGKMVSIGCLHRNVLDAALAKQPSRGICSEISCTADAERVNREEEQDLLACELLLQQIPVVLVKPVDGACAVNNPYIPIYRGNIPCGVLPLFLCR